MNNVDIFSQGTPNKNKGKNPNRRSVDNKTKKIIIAGLLVWQALSVINPTDNIIASPMQVVEGIGDSSGWIHSQFEKIGENSSASSSESTTPSIAPPQTQMPNETSATTTTISPITTLPPVNVTPENTIAPAISPTPETTILQIDSQAVFVSGSIACNEVVLATFSSQITVEGETRVDYPLEAMSSASTFGHEFNKLVPAQGEQLWIDTQSKLNGGDIESALGVSFQSPDDCTGLQFLSE